MARPTVMTTEILERLRQAFAIGCTDEEACAYAKVGVSTLYDYQREHPEFSDEKEQLKREPVLKAKNTVVQSLTDPKNAQWYLERKAKDEFSTMTRVQADNTNTNLNMDMDESLDPEARLQGVLQRIKQLREQE